MALNPPPLKLYDCANFALDDINEFAKGQGYAVLQMVRMVVEVKMPLPSIGSNISQAYSGRGALLF